MRGKVICCLHGRSSFVGMAGKPSANTVDFFSALIALFSELEIEIAELTLDSSSEEVSTTIAGYIAKKLAKRSNCDSCKSLLIASSMDLAENHYLNLLSRGGLIVPSAKLLEYTSHCFATMAQCKHVHFFIAQFAILRVFQEVNGS